MCSSASAEMPGWEKADEMELVIGMGECVVSAREDDVLKTYDLASCVAVTAYSPSRKVAGMIHVVLPSPLAAGDGRRRPSYFAETGVPLLIEAMCRKSGCGKEELDIRIFGGMDSVFHRDVFHIGRNNIDVVKYALLDMGLSILGADLRGDVSRSLSMDVRTGSVEVFRQPVKRTAGRCQ